MPNKDDDHGVWRSYAQRVTPIRGAGKPKKPRAPVSAMPAHKTPRPLHGELQPPVPQALPRFTAPASLAAPVLFDRRTERRFREGAILIDARLDLHGLTQERAYDALARFLAAQVKAGSRKLLVITGQGRWQTGILRASLAGWLESLDAARHIIDLRPAAPRHGGDGAFYIWLKRRDI